ncbi:hypothetical protein BN12_400006 [Nostocoides japonicum T1-X7]|uniref:Thiocillin family RiPP n=1 Tax=Nostocoides japonicum T1-X7 TaxID=1194083 RepID=A0A077M212_9MICO|nr:thiocillin family RiPP [Tetrasphaera japonica]CCH79097.1 hypothetical protein BN12_400006 [Tetrasphaera japonica T1-X7]
MADQVPTPENVDEIELEELTEEGGAATLGTASSLGCPSSLATFGSH